MSDAALSPHWQELPLKYGTDAWQLRVWDDHWYRVFGTRVVLCPIGIGQGVYSSTEAAKHAAERMYRQGLHGAVVEHRQSRVGRQRHPAGAFGPSAVLPVGEETPDE